MRERKYTWRKVVAEVAAVVTAEMGARVTESFSLFPRLCVSLCGVAAFALLLYFSLSPSN